MSDNKGKWLGWLGIIFGIIGLFWQPFWMGSIAAILGLVGLFTLQKGLNRTAKGLNRTAIIIGVVTLYLNFI